MVIHALPFPLIFISSDTQISKLAADSKLYYTSPGFTYRSLTSIRMWIILLGLTSALLASSRSEATTGKKTRQRNNTHLSLNLSMNGAALSVCLRTDKQCSLVYYRGKGDMLGSCTFQHYKNKPVKSQRSLSCLKSK